MATTDLEKLVVQLSADIKSYERALAKAQGTTVKSMRAIERQVQTSATKVEGHFNRLGKTLINFGRGFVAGLGIESLRRFGNAIEETVAQAAQLGDVADRIGVTTDQIQAMQQGAAAANMSFDDLTGSLSNFSKELGKASTGQSELNKLFDDNKKTFSGDFFTDLKTFADLLRNTHGEERQLLITLQAFGRGSPEMVEFLKNGAAGLDDMIKKLKETDTAVDENSIRKAQQWNDRWDVMMVQWSAAWKQHVLTSIGAFDEALTNLSDPTKLNALAQILKSLGLATSALRKLAGADRAGAGLAPDLAAAARRGIGRKAIEPKGPETKIRTQEDE